MKHAWITEHSGSFPIALMCELLGVSRSGYYDSVDRPASPRAERTAKIHASVEQVFVQNHAIYGPAKVAEKLKGRDEPLAATRSPER